MRAFAVDARFMRRAGLVDKRTIGRTTYQRLADAVQSRLPRGGELPAEEWERRHRALTRLLWATALAVAVYSALRGYAVWHIGLDTGGVVVAALVATRSGVGQRMRSLACSFGLLTAAALGVHVSGGITEAHFSFFVVVVLLTLYEDWTVFVLAVLYTLLHHGVTGMIDPDAGFQRARREPVGLGGDPRRLRGGRRRGGRRGVAAE